MREPVTLRLKNQLAELERLDDFLEAFGGSNGLTAKAVAELRLAIDEVVTNVISYAYDDDAEHEIEIRLTGDGRQVTAEIEDDGRPFDPLSAAEPDVSLPVEERPIGGLGIFLVRKVTDGVEYRRAADKNVLVIRKRVADGD